MKQKKEKKGKKLFIDFEKNIKIHPQKYFKYPWGDCIIFCCERTLMS
jgi:hypothetical protein